MANQETNETSDDTRNFPPLTLEDLLERYQIEGDWEEDYKRGGWQDDAVKDIISHTEE